MSLPTPKAISESSSSDGPFTSSRTSSRMSDTARPGWRGERHPHQVVVEGSWRVTPSASYRSCGLLAERSVGRNNGAGAGRRALQSEVYPLQLDGGTGPVPVVQLLDHRPQEENLVLFQMCQDMGAGARMEARTGVGQTQGGVPLREGGVLSGTIGLRGEPPRPEKRRRLRSWVPPPSRTGHGRRGRPGGAVSRTPRGGDGGPGTREGCSETRRIRERERVEHQGAGTAADARPCAGQARPRRGTPADLPLREPLATQLRRSLQCAVLEGCWRADAGSS